MKDPASAPLYPLVFHPLLKERVWGGINLAKLYHKPLPSGAPFGESWEISDRPGDVSVIANGPLAGKDLHWLLEHHGEPLMGHSWDASTRFPLLIKILDAREKLSLQVHPPVSLARELGGEPKTEMWYIAQADEGSELYVGLKKGIRPSDFEEKLRLGTVAECFHRIPVRAGDAMFLPSGRVHAIGAGLVIFEIQQNSDTTYRVFDWNRSGLDGNPRPLHLSESLKSIDFQDFEPRLVEPDWKEVSGNRFRLLANDPLFSVGLHEAGNSSSVELTSDRCQIIGVVTGRLDCRTPGQTLVLEPGQFCLVPASVRNFVLRADPATSYLHIVPGNPE